MNDSPETFITGDDIVRVGEVLDFSTLEEWTAEDRRMADRNRAALDRAEAEDESHVELEEQRRGEDDRWYRVWVTKSRAELEHEKKLKKLAAQHGQAHEDDDGNVQVGKKAERKFRRGWKAGRFRGLRPTSGTVPRRPTSGGAGLARPPATRRGPATTITSAARSAVTARAPRRPTILTRIPGPAVANAAAGRPSTTFAPTRDT